jgi:hypothetical protein
MHRSDISQHLSATSQPIPRIAPLALGFEGDLGSMGRCRVRPSIQGETGVVDDWPLWKDWDLDPSAPHGLAEMANIGQDPGIDTAQGHKLEIWKDWRLESSEFEEVSYESGGSFEVRGS